MMVGLQGSGEVDYLRLAPGNTYVLRGDPPPVRCSMANTGESPWMKSTSGRFS